MHSLTAAQSFQVIATLLILFKTVSTQGIPAQGTCSTACNDYNTILDNCEVDDDNNTDYNFCVCNDPNFKTANSACVACEGTGSDPYKFQQACKSVPPDCTVACSAFNLVIQGCTGNGDQTSCVCGGAYDIQYAGTFNEAFTDCVSCENGGGVAAGWELTCCAANYGCTGLTATTSPAAAGSSVPSSTPAIVQPAPASTTTPPPAAASTPPPAASTPPPSNPSQKSTASSLGGGSYLVSASFLGLIVCCLQALMC